MTEVIDLGLMRQACERGEYLKAGFAKLQVRYPSLVREVRGIGCMLGIELTQDGQPLVDRLQERGFLVNCTHVSVLRFLPPYVVTQEHCDLLLDALQEVFADLKA